MTIRILTLFPGFFSSSLQSSILQRAQKQAHVTFDVINLRDFTDDAHQTADDRPYGGGAGMVMMVEPIAKALQKLGALESDGTRNPQPDRRVILTSAKGRPFTQQLATEYSQLKELIIICGHYEGVDERVVEYCVDEEVSIGEYVLTGGEPAALVMSDAVTRLLPGVLGNAASLIEESHNQPGILAAPQYTRPATFLNWSVPPVLLSGDHRQIEAWRTTQTKPRER